MTLLETERLIRKISDLLKQTVNPDVASAPAADYTAAVHAANVRLQQCEAMIKANDRPQAIQLAETTPNLLDLITVLEFHGSDEWRRYCQQNNLPAAEKIDARAVQILNECYARGITTDHPLYAAYRRAALQRDDETALKTLQSIVRLNPQDANAATELSRLDAKVLLARLAHLGGSLEGSDASSIVAEVEAIEAAGFKHRPDNEVWRKALVIRCGVLLGEAATARNIGDWREVLATTDFIRGLQKEFKFELSSESSKQLESLETWARNAEEKDRKDREFKTLLGELDHKIQQSEEKDTSARYVELPELRDDFEGLHRLWRALTDFARPIPEEDAARFHKRSALLEGEISRRTSVRRRWIMTGVATILLLGTLIIWFALSRMKAQNFSRQLQAAVDQQQFQATEKLLERAHTEKMGSDAVVASAETFVTRENSLLSNFETEFKKLPATLTGQPDASRLGTIADQLTLARNAFNALSPDLKTENEPRLQAFENQWQNFLAESGTVVNGLYEQWVSAAEAQAGELDYRLPLEKTMAQLTALSGLLQKINDCEAGFKDKLPLRSDLAERANAVRAKFSTYEGEWEKINQGLAAIQKARTINDFSDGIKQITASEFTTSAAATAATAIQSLDVSEESVLQNLLSITNPGTWAGLQRPQAMNFIPTMAMPAERKILAQLANDPMVNAMHVYYRLWLGNGSDASVDWITTGTFDDSMGWKQILAWTPSDTATTASFTLHDYGNFDGQFKLSPTQPILRVRQLKVLDETAPFHTVGLDTYLSADGTYTKPLLQVLDTIKDSSEGSPLFRAYLFLQIIDLMQLQPDAWGLSFCPAARADAAQLVAITGDQLVDGDWFVPMKQKALGERLEQFFNSIKPVSYAKQANGLFSLEQAAVQSGLHYAGFIGRDGQPHFLDGISPAEAWGFSAASKQPVLLMTGGQPTHTPAMPLSPLFTLANSRQDCLAHAGVDPADPAFKNVLPPLFQNVSSPKP